MVTCEFVLPRIVRRLVVVLSQCIVYYKLCTFKSLISCIYIWITMKISPIEEQVFESGNSNTDKFRLLHSKYFQINKNIKKDKTYFFIRVKICALHWLWERLKQRYQTLKTFRPNNFGLHREKNRAVRNGDNNSKVPQHANQFVHSIDFNHATIVDRARNFHERLFLEACYSKRDKNAGNEHIDIPDVYESLA